MNPSSFGVAAPSVGMTDQFGNKILNPNWASSSQATQSAPTRKPGNFLTHMFPVAGGVLGSIVGSPIIGGAIGTGLGKLLENKVEKQSLGSGVLGQAAIGGIAGGIGEIPGVQSAIGAVTRPVAGAVGKILGIGGADIAGQAATRGAVNAASDIGAQSTTEAGVKAASEGLTQADQPVTQAVKDYLKSKGFSVPENAIYKKGSALTSAPRNLEATLKASLGGPDTAQAGNLLLDTMGKGKSLVGQYNEMPDIAATIKGDLGGVLAKNTAKAASQDLTTAAADIQAKLLGGGADLTQLTNAQKIMLMKGSPELNGVLDNFNNLVTQVADKSGNVSSQGMLDLNTAIGREIKPQQWNALKGIGDAQLTTADQANFKLWQLTRNQLNTMAPEAGNLLKVQGLAAHDLPAALHHGLSGGGGFGGLRAGISGIPVRGNIPGAQRVVQGAQTSLGRAIQGAGGAVPQAVETAGKALPQILGQNVSQGLSEAENQRTAQVGAQRLANTDFTALDPNIQSLVSSHSQQGNPTGLDPEKIQEAMIQDLKQTGGKNISHLNTILGTITKLQAENSLPSSAVTKVGEYQNSLEALQKLSDAYNSKATGNDLTQLLNDSNKVLAKASGVSGKPLAALLPTPYDNGDTVATKLAQLKQMIDQNYSDQIQMAVDSKKNSTEQASYLGSLVGSPQ